MNVATHSSAYPTDVGKILNLRFPDGSVQHKFPKGVIMQWKVTEQARQDEGYKKIFAWQWLREITDGDLDRDILRTGYCIIGKEPGVSDQWVWDSRVLVFGGDMTSVLAEEVP